MSLSLQCFDQPGDVDLSSSHLIGRITNCDHQDVHELRISGSVARCSSPTVKEGSTRHRSRLCIGVHLESRATAPADLATPPQFPATANYFHSPRAARDKVAQRQDQIPRPHHIDSPKHTTTQAAQDLTATLPTKIHPKEVTPDVPAIAVGDHVLIDPARTLTTAQLF